jgi:inorganic pyrophosphatase
VKRLDRIAQVDKDGRLRAAIESPKGSRHKLKYDPETGAFAVSSTFPAGMSMPFDFGFFPRTRAPDGDPIDVLVLMDGPAYPGVLVPVRLLGVIEAEQSDGGKPLRNDRLIAVAEGSTERGELRQLSDLDHGLLTQIETFFETYDRLSGKEFHPIGRRGPRVALRLIQEAGKKK